MPLIRFSILISVALLSAGFLQDVHGQNLQACTDLLDRIGAFEGQRDPKCAATANRLEDFIYGTPLDESARIRKADLQKEFILSVWMACNASDRMLGRKEVSFLTMGSMLDARLSIVEEEKRSVVGDPKLGNFITKRDLEHYSSVAYAYRAILSVQQELLFSSNRALLPLSKRATEDLRSFVDKITLLVLKQADKQAREANESRVSAQRFEDSWYELLGTSSAGVQISNVASNLATDQRQLQLVKAIVAKKQQAFQEYNDISIFIFQRNAQVYFSRHGWPKDEKENERFRMLYNETLIQFVKDLWSEAENIAVAHKHVLVRLEDVSAALEKYLPFEANQLEDITFFPRLARSKQIDIEAYDLDAFRDGGAHWTYIQMALNDADFHPQLMPDPFALELLSEGVAHLGVLSLRVAGSVSKELGHERLNEADLIAGLTRIQTLIQEHGKAEVEVVPNTISSSENQREKPQEGLLFNDVTDGSGIVFEHRSADWLSRFIRSYTVDTVENSVKTSIPPAFGGGGVAAEDVNNDGLPDLLMLSGLGNSLYINTGNGTFTDQTSNSGLDWKRDDRTAGEPRQPIIADFDNDGLQDVFISYVNDNHRIYRNKGNATFEDMTDQAVFGGKGSVGGPCTAIDYDNDGLLDVYIGYFGDYLHSIHPTLARRNTNGLPNKLFRNLGDFKFEEVKNAHVADAGWSQSIGHADINGDNYQDLIVGNDFGTNTYYLNNGDGTFTDATRELGTDKPSFTMNVGITDLNGDHRPDFYISNIVVMEKDEKYVNPSADSQMKFNADVMANMRVVEANDLFISNRTEDGTAYSLSQDISRGYSATGWSWDADFFDYDNDGDQDLYCLTGMNDFLVYSTENPYYQDPDGTGRSVTFAESHREANVFFENDGDQLLTGKKASGLEVIQNSRSAAFFDMDMDGDEDVILNNYHDYAVLFQNNSDRLENNWIKIRLIGDPDKGITRDAIGAKIIVTAKDLDVWREIHSTTGYLSVHPKEQHIGVGANDKVDVEVIWPDGSTQTFKNLKTDSRYVLKYRGTPTKLKAIKK